MSLQFIIGNSGAGKSFRAYQRQIVRSISECDTRSLTKSDKYVLCNRSGAVYHADTENTRGNASAKRNLKY